MTLEGKARRPGALIGVAESGVVLPSQYFASQRNHAPEQRLMIAVLHDALDCLNKYRFATASHDRRLFDEAKEWFLADEAKWPYSFECICSVLGLDSTAVRQRLRMESATLISARGTCDPDSEALATLRRRELDPRLNDELRQSARNLVWRWQDNGWDEV
jgi:hypothetical protein